MESNVLIPYQLITQANHQQFADKTRNKFEVGRGRRCGAMRRKTWVSAEVSGMPLMFEAEGISKQCPGVKALDKVRLK